MPNVLINASARVAAVTMCVLVAAACGGPDQAAAPKIEGGPVGPRTYATIAPPTAPPTTQPPTPPQPGEVTTIEVFHTVRQGESLAAIAALYSVDVKVLQKHNNYSPENQAIVAGERIRIPAGATMPSNLAPTKTTVTQAPSNAGSTDRSGDGGGTTPTTSASEGSGCTYTIKVGEYPFGVAKKVGISYDALVRANEASGVLKAFLPGDKLVIPPPGSC